MKKLIFSFLLLIPILGIAQGKKISALPTASNLTSSFVPIIQDSSGQYVNRKIPGTSLGGTPLANNGVSLSGDTVQLGGTITKNTLAITGNADTQFYIQLDNNAGTKQSYLYIDQSGSIPFDIGATVPGRQIDISPTDDLITDLKVYLQGSNLSVQTSEIVGSPLERLKIDTLGNISMPNTMSLYTIVNGAIQDLGGELYIDSVSSYLQSYFYQIGKSNLSTLSTTPYTISLGNTIIRGSDSKNSVISMDSVYLDISTNRPFRNNILDNSYYLNTYTTADGSPINRLKIDSVGNVSIINANLFLDKTIDTTAGDAATINKTSGRFRKDTSGTTFTLTNDRITANSIILLTFASSGAAASTYQYYVVAGTGSAVITFGAAPSSDLDINFLVTN